MKIDWSKTSVRLDTDALGRSYWPQGIISLQGWDAKNQTDHDLWYIFAGRGKIVTRAGSFNLFPGSLLWMRPGWDYNVTQEPDKPLAMNFIHFDLIEADESVRPYDAPCPPEVLFPLDVRLVESITNRVVELCQGVGVRHPVAIPMSSEIATQLLSGLLMHLDAEEELPATATSDSTRRRHRDIILSVTASLNNYSAEFPTVPELARQAGYSREHFSRIFKAVTGRSLDSYIIEIRLAKVKTLLSNTNLTIKAIARQLGYRNEYFLSRQFKERTGTSPTAYRNSPHAGGKPATKS